MRFVLLLTCLAVLARCGPVPACQLDELFGDCSAGSCDDAQAAAVPADPAAAVAGPLVASPFGNDTPDDIACDTAIHQSLGSVQHVAPALHDAGAAPFACELPPAPSDGVPQDFSTTLPARALYPPSPPTLKHRPLLI